MNIYKLLFLIFVAVLSYIFELLFIDNKMSGENTERDSIIRTEKIKVYLTLIIGIVYVCYCSLQGVLYHLC